LGAFQNLFGIPGQTPFGPGDVGVPDGPSLTLPPGSNGPLPIPPNNYIDPDGPLGGDEELPPGAFDNFFLPGFDQRTEQNPNGTTDGSAPREDNAAERVGGPRRRVINDGEYGQLVRAKDLVDPGDDLSKAMGSVGLLLEAFRGQ
jgi:hypothetical protein